MSFLFDATRQNKRNRRGNSEGKEEENRETEQKKQDKLKKRAKLNSLKRERKPSAIELKQIKEIGKSKTTSFCSRFLLGITELAECHRMLRELVTLTRDEEASFSASSFCFRLSLPVACSQILPGFIRFHFAVHCCFVSNRYAYSLLKFM